MSQKNISQLFCYFVLVTTSAFAPSRYSTAMQEAHAIPQEVKGEDSIKGKMWAYGGLHNAPYNIFDFRISRHRDGPQEFFANSHGYVQGDCFSGNTSVVIESAGRLTFSACWAHARRYAVECVDYKEDCETFLDMVQAL